MDMFLEFVSMVAGFSTVMLALSLLVMHGVRLGHYLSGQRGRGLVTMLGSINAIYRKYRGDQVEEGDQAQANFILDVLQHRIIDPEPDRPALSPREREGKVAHKTAISIAEHRQAVRRDDVTTAVRLLCEETQDGELVLPERWFLFVDAKKRTFSSFEQFMETTFASIERASTSRFRIMSKRWSMLLSAILVVILNLNAYALFQAMSNAELRSALRQSEAALLGQVDEMGTPDEDKWFGDVDQSKRWLHEVSNQAALVNTMVSHEALGIGWGGSHITEVFTRAPFREPSLLSGPPLSCWAFIWEIVWWLAWLTFSWLLLAQGPAFWADVLRRARPLPDGSSERKSSG